MKKTLFVIILVFAMLLCSACGGSDSSAETKSDTQIGVAVDIDVTQLSATMAYACVSDMYVNTDDYISKSVRMVGEYYAYQDSTTGIVYHLVMIYDATLCCTQGVEFTLANGEYPTMGSEITVVGNFSTYLENGYQFCELADAYLE